jgi:YtkA-like protein
VDGAAVTLSADMPSMPLAHSVPSATAAPGSRAGTYHGTLELPMPGRWVVAARIVRP